MIHLLLGLAAWLRTPKSAQGNNRRCLRRFTDSTLVYPNQPDESCSRQFLTEMREALGIEPATRTLVRSNKIGHSVHVLLLKNIRPPDATVFRN